jgi:uncharacterized protein (DUF2141 family)
MFACSAHALTIDVTGIRNTNGTIACYLYNSEIGFPDEPSKARLKIVAEVSPDHTATCRINASEFFETEVAVSVLHDEDKDGAMKLNFIGIPKEGWAASNNAEAQTFGPPTFQDAKFDPRKVSQQTLIMVY